MTTQYFLRDRRFLPRCSGLFGVSLLLGAALIFTRSAIAQSEHRLGPPTCESCRLVLSDPVIIGSLDGPGAIVPTGYVRKLPDGRIVLGQRDHLKLFSADGSALLVYGRAGKGPGEFVDIEGLHFDGTYLWVFDRRGGRITVLTPSLQFVRVIPNPVRFANASVLRDGRVLLNANVATTDRVGYPLHIADSGGTILRSFGSEFPVARPDLPLFLRRFAIGRDGRIWVADHHRYTVEEWDTLGTRQGAVSRAVDRFPPRSPGALLEDGGKPRPRIQQLGIVGPDTLGVIVVVADRDWKEAISYGEHPDGPDRPTIRLSGNYSDSFVDWIDVRNRRLIVSTRFDERITDFADARHVYGLWEDDLGVPKVTIWKVELIEP